MISIYTAGYMAGSGSDRPDWRADLNNAVGPEARMNINWLHPGVPPGEVPGQGSSALYMVRDLAQINRADAIVALFNLEQARSLGSASEIGIAYAQGKPIIMIDTSPDIGSLDFARALSVSIWPSIEEAAEAIAFLAKGFPGR